MLLKEIVVETMADDTFVRCNATLEGYLNKSVGDTVYKLLKYDREKIQDTTIKKAPNAT